jgi:hypothetical protein
MPISSQTVVNPPHCTPANLSSGAYLAPPEALQLLQRLREDFPERETLICGDFRKVTFSIVDEKKIRMMYHARIENKELLSEACQMMIRPEGNTWALFVAGIQTLYKSGVFEDYDDLERTISDIIFADRCCGEYSQDCCKFVFLSRSEMCHLCLKSKKNAANIQRKRKKRTSNATTTNRTNFRYLPPQELLSRTRALAAQERQNRDVIRKLRMKYEIEVQDPESQETLDELMQTCLQLSKEPQGNQAVNDVMAQVSCS